MGSTLRERAHAMHDLLQRYYLDQSSEQIGDLKIENWNTTLSFLTYFTKGRQLLKGDPSSGKTSLAGLVCGMLGGVSPDMTSRVLVRGTPDLTKEDLTGHLHYGALHQGNEWVVWILGHMMPFFNVDELLRIPTKLQSLVLTGIEDGIWTYANSYSIDTGKRPGFYTINPVDEGSFQLTYALMDRLTSSSEHWPLPRLAQDKKKTANINKAVELMGGRVDKLPEMYAEQFLNAPEGAARDIVKAMMHIGEVTLPKLEQTPEQLMASFKKIDELVGLYRESMKDSDRVDPLSDAIAKEMITDIVRREIMPLMESNLGHFQSLVSQTTDLRTQYREEVLAPLLDVEPLNDEDLEQIFWEIDQIPFDQTATKVAFWWEACMNTSLMYGVKRSEDHIPLSRMMTSDYPDKGHAVSKIEGPFSNRGQSDADSIARAIAWWLGKDTVDTEIYRAAVVCTENHKLPFDATYAAQKQISPRDWDQTSHLMRSLLEEMSQDYTQRNKEFFDVVGVVVNPEFDPYTREGDKGFDEEKSLKDRQWNMVETQEHPVMHAIRQEMSKNYDIDINNPWVERFNSAATATPEEE